MTSPFHWHIFFLSLYTRDTHRKTGEWQKGKEWRVEETTCVSLWTVSRSAFSMQDKTTNEGTNIFTYESVCPHGFVSLKKPRRYSISLPPWMMDGEEWKVSSPGSAVVSKQASAFHLRLPPGRRSPSRHLPKPRHRLLLKELIIDLLRQATTTPICLSRVREEAARWGGWAGRGGKPDEALSRPERTESSLGKWLCF